METAALSGIFTFFSDLHPRNSESFQAVWPIILLQVLSAVRTFTRSAPAMTGLRQGVELCSTGSSSDSSALRNSGDCPMTRAGRLQRLTDRRAVIEPVDQPAVYQVVVEHIRRAMHIGSFVPGDKLPPERELARQLSVARSTVRQAIRVLEGEGYLQARRGATGGIFVLDRGTSEERLAPFVRARLSDLEQIIEFRLALECRAARLAAKRRSHEHLRQLHEAYKAMEQGRGTPRFRAADSAFHLGIADAAGNAWIRNAVEDSRVAIWLPVHPLIANVHFSSQRNHERILSAIRDRDSDAAEVAVADHIEKTRQDLYEIAGADRPPSAARISGH